MKIYIYWIALPQSSSQKFFTECNCVFKNKEEVKEINIIKQKENIEKLTVRNIQLHKNWYNYIRQKFYLG